MFLKRNLVRYISLCYNINVVCRQLGDKIRATVFIGGKHMERRNLGERLLLFRERMNYSQEQIAQFLGVTQGHISNVESGVKNFPFNKLRKLADLYGCKPTDFETDVDISLVPVAMRSSNNPDAGNDLKVVAKTRKVLKNINLMKGVIAYYEREDVE